MGVTGAPARVAFALSLGGVVAHAALDLGWLAYALSLLAFFFSVLGLDVPGRFLARPEAARLRVATGALGLFTAATLVARLGRVGLAGAGLDAAGWIVAVGLVGATLALALGLASSSAIASEASGTPPRRAAAYGRVVSTLPIVVVALAIGLGDAMHAVVLAVAGFVVAESIVRGRVGSPARTADHVEGAVWNRLLASAFDRDAVSHVLVAALAGLLFSFALEGVFETGSATATAARVGVLLGLGALVALALWASGRHGVSPLSTLGPSTAALVALAGLAAFEPTWVPLPQAYLVVDAPTVVATAVLAVLGIVQATLVPGVFEARERRDRSAFRRRLSGVVIVQSGMMVALGAFLVALGSSRQPPDLWALLVGTGAALLGPLAVLGLARPEFRKARAWEPYAGLRREAPPP